MTITIANPLLEVIDGVNPAVVVTTLNVGPNAIIIDDGYGQATISIVSAAPSTLTPDQANTEGTADSFALSNHIHNVPTDVASTISTNANAEGNGTSFARNNHIHQLTAGTALLDHVPQYDGSNWQAVYPESSLDVSRATVVRDDWLSATTTGVHGWLTTVAGGSSAVTMDTTNTDGNHWGIVNITSGNAANRYASLSLLNMLKLGGAAIAISILFRVSTITNTRYRIALGDLTTNADYNNGVYLEYNSGVSANWLIKTASGGTRTSTTTAVAATANAWHKLVISINAAATSVSYTLDGVSLGTITTNIPTAIIGPVLLADSIAATTSTLFVDYYSMTARFTTPR